MIYSEKQFNLFYTNDEYALAHCISEDCEMGMGIAKEFQKRYHLKNTVRLNNKGVCTAYLYVNENTRKIFNLITKEKYYGKPTYLTLRKSLEDMKEQCINNNILKLAMPKIGSGLDKLQWGRVREIIKETFDETNMEILICYL